MPPDTVEIVKPEPAAAAAVVSDTRTAEAVASSSSGSVDVARGPPSTVSVVDAGLPGSIEVVGPPSTGGSPFDLVYHGAYVQGAEYKDGDLVVYNNVVWLCVRPTSAAPSGWPV
jgi:hypothetical protein